VPSGNQNGVTFGEICPDRRDRFVQRRTRRQRLGRDLRKPQYMMRIKSLQCRHRIVTMQIADTTVTRIMHESAGGRGQSD
jgi:hypothetical protein